MDLVLRAVFVFAFVLLLTRVVGKRELGKILIVKSDREGLQ